MLIFENSSILIIVRVKLMEIDLTRLIHNYVEMIEINEEVVIPIEYLAHAEIKALSPLLVKGFMRVTGDGLYALNLKIKGEMTLVCAVTLGDVKYPLDFTMEEILSENEDDEEDYLRINQNTIDFLPIIWQNILLEVPLKVTSKDAYQAKLKGNGWELIQD